MHEITVGVADMFSGLSPASWGAIFGALLTATLAYLGSLVTHAGNFQGRRLTVREKRAVLDVRDLAIVGTTLTGDLVNLGPTAATKVGLCLGSDKMLLLALGGGERVPFSLVLPSGLAAKLKLSYTDFNGQEASFAIGIEHSSAGVRVVTVG